MDDNRRTDASQDGDGRYRPDFDAFDDLTKSSKSSVRVVAELLYRKCDATLLVLSLAMLLVFYLGVRSLDDRSDLTDVHRWYALVASIISISVLAVITVFVRKPHGTNSEEGRSLSTNVADQRPSA